MISVHTVTTKHTKTRKRVASGRFDSCCHAVDYYYNIGGARLSDDALQQLEDEAERRATELISGGTYAGELCCATLSPVAQREQEFHGWFMIAD